MLSMSTTTLGLLLVVGGYELECDFSTSPFRAEILPPLFAFSLRLLRVWGLCCLSRNVLLVLLLLGTASRLILNNQSGRIIESSRIPLIFTLFYLYILGQRNTTLENAV